MYRANRPYVAKTPRLYSLRCWKNKNGRKSVFLDQNVWLWATLYQVYTNWCHRVLWSLAIASWQKSHVALFYMYFTLLPFIFLKSYTDHSGITFIYTVCLLRVTNWTRIMSDALKHGLNPRVIGHWPFQGGNSSFAFFMYVSWSCMYFMLNMFKRMKIYGPPF